MSETRETPMPPFGTPQALGECSFCGCQCGQELSDLTAEIHATLERLVGLAPSQPTFMTNTKEYVEALAEAKRVLGG